MTPRDPDTAGGEPVERAVERLPEPAGTRPARWDVATLCGDTGEAILVHKGEHYRLRITARGRLILTK
jgi:hemin uptake protein HemP